MKEPQRTNPLSVIATVVMTIVAGCLGLFVRFSAQHPNSSNAVRLPASLATVDGSLGRIPDGSICIVDWESFDFVYCHIHIGVDDALPQPKTWLNGGCARVLVAPKTSNATPTE